MTCGGQRFLFDFFLRVVVAVSVDEGGAEDAVLGPALCHLFNFLIFFNFGCTVDEGGTEDDVLGPALFYFFIFLFLFFLFSFVAVP
jgi:hypothetical protein